MSSDQQDDDDDFDVNEQQLEEIGNCAVCMSAVCAVCGHEPCPVCVDDCDHQNCIDWPDDGGNGKKTHTCVFVRCPEHALKVEL